MWYHLAIVTQLIALFKTHPFPMWLMQNIFTALSDVALESPSQIIKKTQEKNANHYVSYLHFFRLKHSVRRIGKIYEASNSFKLLLFFFSFFFYLFIFQV